MRLTRPGTDVTITREEEEEGEKYENAMVTEDNVLVSSASAVEKLHLLHRNVAEYSGGEDAVASVDCRPMLMMTSS